MRFRQNSSNLIVSLPTTPRKTALASTFDPPAHFSLSSQNLGCFSQLMTPETAEENPVRLKKTQTRDGRVPSSCFRGHASLAPPALQQSERSPTLCSFLHSWLHPWLHGAIFFFLFPSGELQRHLCRSAKRRDNTPKICKTSRKKGKLQNIIKYRRIIEFVFCLALKKYKQTFVPVRFAACHIVSVYPFD